ncbi:MAG: hypothetical protein ACTS5R_01050, partial [Candidatus Hodgkinia cicadicola]
MYKPSTQSFVVSFNHFTEVKFGNIIFYFRSHCNSFATSSRSFVSSAGFPASNAPAQSLNWSSRSPQICLPQKLATLPFPIIIGD